MADWKKLLIENPPASDIASSPSSGKVLKVSSNGTGLEWADDAGGAFSDNGTTASVTNRVITATGTGSNIPTLDLNPDLTSGTISRIRVQTSGKDLRFNLRNGASTSDVMTIAHSGGVGIGTTSPSAKLDVSGGALHVNSAGSTSSAFQATGQNGQVSFSLIPSAGNATSSIVAVNTILSLRPNGTNVLNVTNAGRVGINTTSPSDPLHVVGNAKITGLLSFNSASYIQDVSNNYLKLRIANGDYFAIHGGASDTEYFRLTNDGKIGIGNSSPSYALDVTGVGRFKASQTTDQLILRDSTNSTNSSFRSVSGTLFIKPDGSNIQATLTSTGRLGIGTSSPALPLQVNGANSGVANFVGSGSNEAWIGVDSTGTGGDQWLLISSANGGGQGGAGAFAIYNNDTAVNGLTITNTGLVGIGTSSPSHPMHINSSVSNGQLMQLHNTNNADGTFIKFTGANSSSKDWQIGSGTLGYYIYNLTDSAMGLMVSNAGLVGVGTSSPVEKLDISAGNIRLDNQQLLTFATTDANSGRVGIQGDESSDFLRFRTDNANRMAITNTGVGINTLSPTEKLHVAGNILLPLDASSTSHKLKLTGSGTSEIYRNSYDLYLTTSLTHYHIGNNGLTLRTSDSARQILLEHSTNNKRISSTMGDFALLAGHTGGLGFLTQGSTGTYTAIQQVYTDNNTGGLKFNTKASGTDTERMRITSTGLVGIGTSSPSVELDVAGSAKVQGLTTSGTAPAITWEETDLSGVAHKLIMQVNGRSLSWNSIGDGGFVSTDFQMHRTGAGAYFHKWFIAGSSKMILSNSGYLGVGTDSPGSILELSSSNPAITLTDTDGGNGRISANGGHLSFQADYNNAVGGSRIDFESDGTLRMRIDANSRISLSNNDSGSSSTLFGQSAGNALTSNAQGNSAFGHESLLSNTDADRNTGFGYQTIRAVTTGSNNTAVGYEAVRGGDVTYTQNTGVGGHSLYSVTSAVGNSALGFRSAEKNTTGNYNVALGWFSLYQNQTGNNNTAVGTSAMQGASSQSHSNNTSVGYKSLYSITTASASVAVGKEALYSTTTGGSNTALGHQAMYYGTESDSNVAVGQSALEKNVTGDDNTAIGYQSQYGASNQSHSSNTSVGYKSLFSITTGSNNVAIGKQALDAGTTVTSNVAIGVGALGNNVTGNYNTAVGQNCLLTNTNSFMTAVGYNALGSNAGGGANVGFGYNAGYGNHTGSNNTYLGYEAGKGVSNNANSNNTGVGRDALKAIETGGDNSALGYSAGKNLTTGHSNSIVGVNAAENLTTGYENVIIGHRAGNLATGLQRAVIIGKNAGDAINSDVHGTIAIGYNALTGLTSGVRNTAIGYESGKVVSTHLDNTFVGYQSGRSTTGSYNVAVGKYAMYEGAGADYNTAIGTNSLQNVTGDNNTALGMDALVANTSGYQNTTVGSRSGNQINTGDSHVLIGYSAGTTLTDGRRCTVVGDESDVSASGALNQTVIGQGAIGVQDNSAIIGNSACADVFMGDNGSAWSTTSDGRLKENIKEWSTGLDAINKLRVVEYNFKEDNPHKYDHKKKRQGIIAQEAIEAIPEMIKDDGEWLTANQEPMIWALVNAVQELTKKVNELETKLNKEN